MFPAWSARLSVRIRAPLRLLGTSRTITLGHRKPGLMMMLKQHVMNQSHFDKECFLWSLKFLLSGPPPWVAPFWVADLLNMETPLACFLPTTTRLCTRPALHLLTSSGRSSEWMRFWEVQSNPFGFSFSQALSGLQVDSLDQTSGSWILQLVCLGRPLRGIVSMISISVFGEDLVIEFSS